MNNFDRRLKKYDCKKENHVDFIVWSVADHYVGDGKSLDEDSKTEKYTFFLVLGYLFCWRRN